MPQTDGSCPLKSGSPSKAKSALSGQSFDNRAFLDPEFDSDPDPDPDFDFEGARLGCAART
jgi:hypothetical protein